VVLDGGITCEFGTRDQPPSAGREHIAAISDTIASCASCHRSTTLSDAQAALTTGNNTKKAYSVVDTRSLSGTALDDAIDWTMAELRDRYENGLVGNSPTGSNVEEYFQTRGASRPGQHSHNFGGATEQGELGSYFDLLDTQVTYDAGCTEAPAIVCEQVLVNRDATLEEKQAAFTTGLYDAFGGNACTSCHGNAPGSGGIYWPTDNADDMREKLETFISPPGANANQTALGRGIVLPGADALSTSHSGYASNGGFTSDPLQSEAEDFIELVSKGVDYYETVCPDAGPPPPPDAGAPPPDAGGPGPADGGAG
jgi:mono/diheme cytochrome c family protein